MAAPSAPGTCTTRRTCTPAASPTRWCARARGTRSRRFVEFLGYTVPWYSGRDAADPAVGAGLLDTRGTFSAYLRVDDRVFLTGELVGRGVEASMTSLALLDLTVHGRKETWQDVPDGGWPQPDGPSGW